LKFLTLLCYILRSLVLRGPLRTMQMAVKERSGDKRFNIDTSGLQLEKRPGSHHYQGASYLVLEQIFSTLAGFPVSTRFVDVGAGLGRVIFFAESRGFEWLRGIEMNGSLVEKANENLGQYQKQNPQADIQFCHADALNFDYPSNSTVYFFFNPFGEEIMDVCLERICTTATDENWFIYMNPLYRSCFEKRGFSKIKEINTNFYTEAVIYKSKVLANSAVI